MKPTIGKKIDVGDSISRSIRIISSNPIILVPQLIVSVPILIFDLFSTSSLGVWGALASLASAVLTVLVVGSYPLMVKTILDGGQVSISAAVINGIKRFWSILAAAILVGLIVIVGAIALIVPGIIFLTWYAYTIPAIMLDGKGALEGMSASKAFGRDKKISTFLIVFVIGLAALVVYGIELVLLSASPVAGRLVDDLLSIPIDVWGSVALSYTYITYGPSSTAATTEAQGTAQGAPPMAVSRYCSNCGKPVQTGATFCSNCGSPMT